VRHDTLESSYLSGSLPNFARVLGAVRDGEGFGTALWFATDVHPWRRINPATHGIGF